MATQTETENRPITETDPDFLLATKDLVVNLMTRVRESKPNEDGSQSTYLLDEKGTLYKVTDAVTRYIPQNKQQESIGTLNGGLILEAINLDADGIPYRPFPKLNLPRSVQNVTPETTKDHRTTPAKNIKSLSRLVSRANTINGNAFNQAKAAISKTSA